MNESDFSTMRTKSGCGSGEPKSRALGRCDGGSNVRHTQCDVVDTLPSMIEESRQTASSRKRLHQLQVGLPHWKK